MPTNNTKQVVAAAHAAASVCLDENIVLSL